MSPLRTRVHIGRTSWSRRSQGRPPFRSSVLGFQVQLPRFPMVRIAPTHNQRPRATGLRDGFGAPSPSKVLPQNRAVPPTPTASRGTNIPRATFGRCHSRPAPSSGNAANRRPVLRRRAVRGRLGTIADLQTGGSSRRRRAKWWRRRESNPRPKAFDNDVYMHIRVVAGIRARRRPSLFRPRGASTRRIAP